MGCSFADAMSLCLCGACPFYTTPIPKKGPNKPNLSFIWTLFWHGGGGRAKGIHKFHDSGASSLVHAAGGRLKQL